MYTEVFQSFDDIPKNSLVSFEGKPYQCTEIMIRDNGTQYAVLKDDAGKEIHCDDYWNISPVNSATRGVEANQANIDYYNGVANDERQALIDNGVSESMATKYVEKKYPIINNEEKVPATSGYEMNETNVEIFRNRAQNEYDQLIKEGVAPETAKAQIKERYPNSELGIDYDKLTSTSTSTKSNDTTESPSVTSENTEQPSKSQNTVVGIKDYTKINFSTVYGMINEWNALATTFEGTIPKALENPGFMALESCGLSGGFPGQYDATNEALIANIKSIINTSQTAIDSLKAQDENLAGLVPPTNPRYPGGGGGGENSDSQIPSFADTSEEQMAFYENMSMSNLEDIAMTLSKMAQQSGKSINELLQDVSYANTIKENLLASKNLPTDLTKLYANCDPKIIQEQLNSIFKGQNSKAIGLTDTTKLTIKNYLTSIAQNNNMTISELVNNESNSSILKGALKELNSVSSCIKAINEKKLTALDVYDGNIIDELKDTAVNVVRDHIDVVAEGASISSETLLTDSANGEAMSGELQNLGKTSVFTNYLTEYTNDSIKNILSSIIG